MTRKYHYSDIGQIVHAVLLPAPGGVRPRTGVRTRGSPHAHFARSLMAAFLVAQEQSSMLLASMVKYLIKYK